MSRQLLFLLTLTATVVLSTHNPKIAILGGGISSLSTAYNLLTHSTQDLDITLYQVGWRLGGKAHTGRNPNHGDRIEEHGVHLLFGGYRYVFEVMDRVYRELGRPNEHPLARWEDVVLAQNEITVADFQGGTCNGSGCFGPGTWQQISIPFPKMGPDPWKTGISWNSPEYLKKEIISSCTSYFLLLLRHLIPTPLPPSPSLATLVTIAEAHLHTIPPSRELYAIFRIFLATAVGILRANFSSEGFWPYLEKRDFRAFLVENGCPDDSYVLYQTPIRLAYYASFHDAAGGPREQFAAATALQMFYNTLTYRGSFSYYMLPGTGETLVLPLYQFLVNRGVRFEFFHNVVDIRTGDNGGTDGNGGHASVGSTDRNDGNGGHAPVGGTDQNDGNGGHASVGGTDRNDGNGGHPSVGGTYGNNSDGVNFIDVIEIDVQAELADPSVPYYPLINITTPKGTFEAWPNTPLYDQISAEQRNILRGYNLESPWSSGYPVRKKSLRRGVDFDVVVSGLPVAVYRHIGEGLRRSSQRWDAMVRGVQTTPTFGIQLWFTKTPQDLGAKLPSALDGTVEEFKLLAYDSPFEGFADYSHTLPYENHPLAKSVLYLSDTLDPIPGTHPFSDQDYPQQEKNLLIQRVDKWLNSRFLSVYPKAADEKGGFDYNLLVDTTNGTGIDRLRAQWFSVNIDPSNLYTLASSGTHQFRIRPDESPWENLFLVGDWTNLDYDLGCADNAVYSGQVAAEKILKRFGVFK